MFIARYIHVWQILQSDYTGIQSAKTIITPDKKMKIVHFIVIHVYIFIILGIQYYIMKMTFPENADENSKGHNNTREIKYHISTLIS